MARRAFLTPVGSRQRKTIRSVGSQQERDRLPTRVAVTAFAVGRHLASVRIFVTAAARDRDLKLQRPFLPARKRFVAVHTGNLGVFVAQQKSGFVVVKPVGGTKALLRVTLLAILGDLPLVRIFVTRLTGV